ncbi:aldehyde dehydrogenase family protein [Candidatus Pelagibacter sp. HIMB1542]|uniref:aldehyde dehydrogenase family protein n=1 Tax=Candidatus Pelagibacter sp. HIMB1542 TaxID=3413346 RepID=UPI003F8774AF
MQKIKLKKLFYNNQWKKPLGAKFYKHYTYNGTEVELPICNKEDIKKCVNSSKIGAKKFKAFSNIKKSKILKKISSIIKKEANTLALKESVELGKNFFNAKKEMLACADLWKHASKEVKKKKNKIINKKNVKLIEYMDPVGIVCLIIPWNFPMIVLSERLPYILAAGNSVIIKPSENGSLSINYFIDKIQNKGFPVGTINLITGNVETGKNLIKDKDINMISFTGSTKSGKEIYKESAKSLKRLSLELGGKNPMAIFHDANLNKAVDDILFSFVHNAGQCCVSGSRLYIHSKIYINFMKKLKYKLDKIKSYQSTTTLNQYLKIKKIVSSGIKKKIPVLYKRKKLFDDQNRVVYPIIFKKNKNSSILDDEIFGPVLTIETFNKTKNLINLMNNTNYGLSALIWTKNKKKALNLAKEINFGRIWINGNISQNYPELSIGGFKESGLNRETGVSGIKTYSEIKSLIVN